MSESLILHHYDLSPYAEKIRLMMGATQSHWYSLHSPVKPPRPNLDPLTGGYRRIPVAQKGADIFCDTAIIAKEVAALTNEPLMDPENMGAESSELMARAEGNVFFCALTALPKTRMLGSMLKQFGVFGTFGFMKDRLSLLDGSDRSAMRGISPKMVLQSYLEDCEARLSSHDWINGDTVSVADFACFHPLWLHVTLNRKPLEAGAKVCQWFDNVSHIGHGQPEEIDQARGFAQARDNEPRALPDSIDTGSLVLGARVSVAPSDYGMIPVEGELAALTDSRVIIARHTDEFGAVHVHFPRAQYSVTAL